MFVIAIIGSLAAILISPWIAARIMGLSGGAARGALVGLVTLGLMQIIGMVAGHLGPMGGIIGIMGMLAAWYQVVKIVHGTDTAGTFVFMFWHLFFQLLILSLVSLVISPDAFWMYSNLL